MLNRDTHRVMPHQDGVWQVKCDGAKRASHRANTKHEAEQIGRKICQNQHTELQIHKKDETIKKIR